MGPSRAAGLVALALLVILTAPLAGCLEPGAPPGDGAEDRSDGTDAADALPPLLDLKPTPDDRQVWFGPLPEMPTRPGRTFVGAEDFMDLFRRSAPWQAAAERVHVVQLYGEWVAWHATDAELEQVVQDLRRRKIQIAVEGGPLPGDGPCGSGVEGFAGIDEGRRIVRRIHEAGGRVRYLTMDEPFAFAAIYDGPEACHWDPERVAEEAVRYVEDLRRIEPALTVGESEPLWGGVDVADYGRWMDAYRAEAGEPLAYVHLDVAWDQRGDWPEAAAALQEVAADRGVRFGMIYFGDRTDATDRRWTGHAEERFAAFEARRGHRPDDAVFQSWHDKPDRTLPEGERGTFTDLLLRYHRPRTVLDLALDEGGSGPVHARGTLALDDGAPLEGRDVVVRLRPVDGPGVVANVTVEGVVPAGATEGNVGVRVNSECGGCVGSADLVLHEVAYREGAGPNRVPDHDLDAGGAGWDIWGTAEAEVETSTRDDGSAWQLRVNATPDQEAGVNSDRFEVTPGASYVASFVARVAPGSVGSGALGTFFLGTDGEVDRHVEPLDPGRPVLGAATTAGDGSYAVALEDLPSEGVHVVEAGYGGAPTGWPAFAEVPWTPAADG